MSSITFQGNKPKGLREEILDVAEGTYSEDIMKMANLICKTIDLMVNTKGPEEFVAYWTGNYPTPVIPEEKKTRAKKASTSKKA